MEKRKTKGEKGEFLRRKRVLERRKKKKRGEANCGEKKNKEGSEIVEKRKTKGEKGEFLRRKRVLERRKKKKGGEPKVEEKEKIKSIFFFLTFFYFSFI